MRRVRVGLVGLGTVGSGVVEIFTRHAEDFKRRTGVDVGLAAFADRDVARAEGLALPEGSFHSDASALINDPSIDIVIELIGGTGVAREVVLAALGAGKSVVTANKALMATHGQEVMQAAETNGVDILFEASVGGGIPIISPLKHSLISNEISRVAGIVNGTTNYMLTRMDEDGLGYDQALKEAQERGFAEADPTADVDGLDAAAKIAILASIAFNSRIVASQVSTEGIRKVDAADIAYARQMGMVVKLLAVANRTDAGIDIRVHPAMIRAGHPLASVNGVYNAIYVVGDAVGETMFFGEGAGSLPAASAVVGDVLEVARHIQAGCLGLVGCTCNERLAVLPTESLASGYYMRITVEDRPGVLAAIAKSLGDHEVSIASVLQTRVVDSSAEIVIVTHSAGEAGFRKALAQIDALPTVREIASVIRVEDM